METSGGECRYGCDSGAGLWDVVLGALDWWSGRNLYCQGTVMFLVGPLFSPLSVPWKVAGFLGSLGHFT